MSETSTTTAADILGMAPYLQVHDMPTSISFYRDKLGFKIVSQSEPELGDDCNWVLLKLNNIELMLNTIYEKENRPVEQDKIRRIGHGDVMLYFGCPDIDAIYAKLWERGVNIKRPPYITGYGFKAIHFSDPDGYGICFHWPAN
jgi:glyoxylase I family protein